MPLTCDTPIVTMPVIADHPAQDASVAACVSQPGSELALRRGRAES